ncbi:hypothetical protein I6A94_41280, partial [Frankia sp. CN4]|nr:hypothetical protein [Frankia nepalensis]
LTMFVRAGAAGGGPIVVTPSVTAGGQTVAFPGEPTAEPTPTGSPSPTVPPTSAPPTAGPTSGPTGGPRPGAGGVVFSASAVPWVPDDRVQLPGSGTVDWVLFGDGRDRVNARAAIRDRLIDASRLARVGDTRGGFRTTFSWTNGTPESRGSRDDDRLVVPGRGSATLSVRRGGDASELLLYAGGTTNMMVTVSAPGHGSRTFTLWLGFGASANGVIIINLGGLPASVPATVTLTSAEARGFNLAAAVLRSDGQAAPDANSGGGSDPRDDSDPWDDRRDYPRDDSGSRDDSGYGRR